MALNDAERVGNVLGRRLPAVPASDRQRLVDAYLEGARASAVERTTGRGPIPTTLGSERGQLLAYVCRALGRLLTEDEIGALLRITSSAARTLQKNMLAVFDDLPDLVFKAAFERATRDGRGSEGDIQDGYRVKFSKAERLEMAKAELERRGLMCEVLEATATRHVLLVDPLFEIDAVLPEKRR
jgi:hypothetical protein